MTSLELFCNAVVCLPSKETQYLLLDSKLYIHNKDQDSFHDMDLKSVDGI